LGEVVGWIGGADVECPAVGCGGVVVDVVFAEVECDGAVRDWEAGCCVVEAAVGVVCHGGGFSIIRVSIVSIVLQRTSPWSFFVV